MTTGTQAPDQMFGNEVMDAEGNTIGKVDGVWVDDATNELEFVSVKTGKLMGKTHIIPVAHGRVDANAGTITVPYASDQINGAPSFTGDAELSPDDEDRIYSHYGVSRSTGQSPTGLPGGERAGGTATTDTSSRNYGAKNSGDRGMDLAEEQLQVGKRSVDAGRVRLRKVVHTEHQEVPVELRREDVQVERTSATGTDVPDNAFQEQEIEVPVTREEAVVDKEAHVTGRVNVNKTIETETRNIGGEIRSEDVEVVDDTDGSGRRERGNR